MGLIVMKVRGRQYHINLDEKSRARYAFVCGSPERVKLIASTLDNPSFVTQNREFLTYSGILNGERVLVTSTGIGGPSAAIAFEELNNLGVDTIIRIGTCGGIQLNISAGDAVIATGAVRMDGTTKEYAPIEFPAVADFQISAMLIQACAEIGIPYKAGIVQSKDSFYGQHNPESSAVSAELFQKWEAWKRCGVLASEMECSTLFVVSALRKMRAGAILRVIWNQERTNSGYQEVTVDDNSDIIKAAVIAMQHIIESDKK